MNKSDIKTMALALVAVAIAYRVPQLRNIIMG